MKPYLIYVIACILTVGVPQCFSAPKRQKPEALPRQLQLDFERAIRKGDSESVKAMLAAGGDPNSSSFYEPPILGARDVSMLEILIKHGADVNRRAKVSGKSALEVAASSGSLRACLKSLNW